jgi:hypothetical protein
MIELHDLYVSENTGSIIYVYRGKIFPSLKCIVVELTKAGLSDILAAELVSRAKREYNTLGTII